MNRRSYGWVVWLVMVAGLLVVGSSMADVLVTRDGARIETQGPWEVKGRQVVFTLPNGTLSALRTSEVDLEASRAATDFVPEPEVAAEPPKERPEPVMVLTNKDIPEVFESAGEEGEGQAGGKKSLKSPRDREPVQVVNWKRAAGSDGLEIRGTLRNTGRTIAANVGLEVQVKDAEGEVAETASAFLQARSLVAGQSTTFRVVLTEVIEFIGEPIFNVTSTGMTLGGSSFAGGQRASQSDGDDAGGAGPSGAAGGTGTGVGPGGPGADRGGNPDSANEGPGTEEPEAAEIAVDPNG